MHETRALCFVKHVTTDTHFRYFCGVHIYWNLVEDSSGLILTSCAS